MNWLKKFMYGRYGADQLSIALIVLSLVLSFVTAVIPIPFIRLLTYIPLILCYFRFLSKNLAKRRAENAYFLTYWHPIKKRGTKKLNRLKDIKTHHYYKCPQCSQTLRVPRGKGKIRITCPTCKNKFSKKS